MSYTEYSDCILFADHWKKKEDGGWWVSIIAFTWKVNVMWKVHMEPSLSYMLSCIYSAKSSYSFAGDTVHGWLEEY